MESFEMIRMLPADMSEVEFKMKALHSSPDISTQLGQGPSELMVSDVPPIIGCGTMYALFCPDENKMEWNGQYVYEKKNEKESQLRLSR